MKEEIEKLRKKVRIVPASESIMASKDYERYEAKEVVHHKNGDKQDNRIENLIIYPSQSSHKKEHPLSKETKKKISNSLKGRIFSKEHRKNLSKSLLSNQNGKKTFHDALTQICYGCKKIRSTIIWRTE